MDTNILFLVLVITVVVGGGLIFFLYSKKNGSVSTDWSDTNKESVKMQMQAYERLILLTDRIALPNLISRINQAGVSVREMQLLLTQSIKESMYLYGMQVDRDNGLNSRGFAFTNPNASSTCGCGSSFAV